MRVPTETQTKTPKLPAQNAWKKLSNVWNL